MKISKSYNRKHGEEFNHLDSITLKVKYDYTIYVVKGDMEFEFVVDEGGFASFYKRIDNGLSFAESMRSKLAFRDISKFERRFYRVVKPLISLIERSKETNEELKSLIDPYLDHIDAIVGAVFDNIKDISLTNQTKILNIIRF
jgi:hypothetical protein